MAGFDIIKPMNSLDKTDHSVTSQSRDDEIARLTELVQSLNSTLKTQDIKIQALIQEVAYLRRMRYGVKNEAMSAEQRSLFEDDVVQDIAAVEAELPATTAAPRARSGRQTLPEHLERVVVRHEPDSCTCSACQSDLVKIGEDVSEQLDIEPARFFVIRHIRPQYACRKCETITAAPVAPAVIDGSLAAPGLLTWVATSKYLDHLPLYRLEQIAARQQVNLSRSTMSEWIGRMGFALQPLADRLAELLRQRQVLHADETPVKQLDPGAGKTKRAYLWSYRSNDLDEGRRSWCSITSAADPVSMRETFCMAGKEVSWSTTTAATRRCLPPMHNLLLPSLAAGRMPGANSSTFRSVAHIHRRRKRCGVLPNFTLLKQRLAKWIMRPVENTARKTACQYWWTCTTG